jgi:large subunit ribosomal protein L7e
MLQRIQPYVAYGYPTRKTISNLIYSRGSGRVGRTRIPLTNNAIIEETLGEHKIECIEDLIEQIHTCGPYFKEANNFLWTFKLHSPRGGWRNKKKSYQEGGDAGNREELINALLTRML